MSFLVVSAGGRIVVPADGSVSGAAGPLHVQGMLLDPLDVFWGSNLAFGKALENSTQSKTTQKVTPSISMKF